MSKFTPGPWFVDESHVSAEDGTIVCDFITKPEDRVLIAAAPELLDAAKRALRELDGRDDDSLAMIRIGLSEAIAKAMGEDHE